MAAAGQELVDPDTVVPSVGVAGAIAALIGAYALLYPHARILCWVLIPFFVTFVEIPALILAAVWFALQAIPARRTAAARRARAAACCSAWPRSGSSSTAGRRSPPRAREPCTRRPPWTPTFATALLVGGLIFVGLFAAMTIAVAVEFGFDVLTVAAGLIVLMLALPLIGALRNPPK